MKKGKEYIFTIGKTTYRKSEGTVFIKRKTKRRVRLLLPSTCCDDLFVLSEERKGLKLDGLEACLYIIASTSIRITGSIFTYACVHNTKLREAAGSKYAEYIRSLADAKIISVHRVYSKGNYPMSYSVDRRYEEIPCQMVEMKIDEDVVKNNFKQIPKTKMLAMFKKDVDSLKLNFDILSQVIADYAKSIQLEIITSPDDVDTQNVYIKPDRNSDKKGYYVSVEYALAEAERKGLSLIQERDYCLIANPVHHRNWKMMNTMFVYSEAAMKICNDLYWVTRAESNDRLHSNLTEMPNVLFDEICRQNELTQIDLKNSQFCFMASLLDEKFKNTEDGQLFTDLAYSGRLYEYIQSAIGLKSRDAAKLAALRAFFGNVEGYSHTRKAIRALFPNVFHWIDRIKRTNDASYFALMLQKEEASVFVDEIYKGIKDMGMLCFSKHDCIIVRNHDAEKAKEFMEHVFEMKCMSGVLEVKSF